MRLSPSKVSQVPSCHLWLDDRNQPPFGADCATSHFGRCPVELFLFAYMSSHPLRLSSQLLSCLQIHYKQSTMQPVVFAASFLWLCSFALSRNIFNKPPSGGLSGDYSENPTYQEGQQVEFLWESDVTYVDIGIFQKYPAPSDKYYSAYVVRKYMHL